MLPPYDCLAFLYVIIYAIQFTKTNETIHLLFILLYYIKEKGIPLDEKRAVS